MKDISKKQLVLLGISIFFIFMLIVGSCDVSKRLNQRDSGDWSQKTYIDSVSIKMPQVQIFSEELKKLLDTLIIEASLFEPMKGFPDYPAGISVSTLKESDKLISLSIGKSYIMSYHFPGAEDNSPFYPDIYPLIPSKLGLSNYKGYQVDYLWTMKSFISNNDIDNPNLIRMEEDSIELIAYAPRLKETDEWVYMLMPSVTLYCEVVGDKLFFKRFEYDDGSIKYVK